MARVVQEQQGTSAGCVLAWVPIVAGLLFVLAPQVALIVYAFVDSNYNFTADGFTSILTSPGFASSLSLTLVISVATVIVLILCLVPVIVVMRLWAPRLEGLLAMVCTLPLVIPAIALVAGLMSVLRAASRQGRGSIGASFSQFMQMNEFPIVLVGTYVVLCLPFTYRSLNAALSSIPLRTLYEASSSLGAKGWTTLRSVVLPNIAGSVLFSAWFAFALAFGEYTVASTMAVHTLPVWMATLAGTNFRASIAASLLSNFLTWTLLAFATIHAGRFGKRRRAKELASADAHVEETNDEEKSQETQEAAAVHAAMTVPVAAGKDD